VPRRLVRGEPRGECEVLFVESGQMEPAGMHQWATADDDGDVCGQLWLCGLEQHL
jgi:hypothetical protein